MQIKVDDSVVGGAYANVMQVSHSKEEFIMDFVSLYPPLGKLVARVITSPGHMKRIVKALEENLARYEKEVGKIEIAEEPKSDFGFDTK